MTVEEILARYSQLIENELERLLPLQEDQLRQDIVKAMRYSLFAGGKRIRPALTLEFCRIFGGNINNALPYAAAIEMVHTYSLIHDDLPAMDNDDFRRGKPTCHKKFNEAIAILAGDGLLNLAFETISAHDENVDDKTKILILRELSSASGWQGMIGGQVIDLQSEDKDIDIDKLKTMHSLKTGAMIKASVKIGCILGNADETQIADAEKYAECIGLAFQVVDDILDVTGDSKKLGKTTGKDNLNKKSTFVTLMGLDKSREIAKDLTLQAKDAISSYKDNDFLCGFADYLLSRNC